ncbi:MAG: chemotaxis protein CheW, partial [Acidobacteriota bacterium]
MLASGGRDHQAVVFLLNEQRYALKLSVVGRIVRAVEVTGLPKAPEIVLGVIRIEGRIIPVMNMRKRLHLPEKEIDLSDQFLIAQTARRIVALEVDAVLGVVDYDE